MNRTTRALATSKVPEVTLLFWVAKLLTTGVGETTWDALEIGVGQWIALVISGVLLIGALIAQFRAASYGPWTYWFAVVLVSVFGTTLADTVHNVLGVPYTVSTLVALIGLMVVFALWRTVEGTLSIHSIRTPRREAFYWATVMLTFALGTAAGDWSADTLHLGYLPSGLIFLGLFLLPALAYRFLGLNPILAFWVAYVLTRPLGASFADYLGGPAGRGGIELGMAPVSVVLGLLIVGIVGYFSRAGVDQPQAGSAAALEAEPNTR